LFAVFVYNIVIPLIEITLSYSTRMYLVKMSNDSYKLNILLI